jgi:hypothetical protein
MEDLVAVWKLVAYALAGALATVCGVMLAGAKKWVDREDKHREHVKAVADSFYEPTEKILLNQAEHTTILRMLAEYHARR